jgi:hypothetical protein
MELRIQILAIAVSAAMLLVVLELVRRKAFLERYALLWLLSAIVLLALSVWRGMLEWVSQLVGIAYPPNALFLVAFGFVLILLLHFSLAVSKLSDQSKVLAQRLALLEQRQSQLELTSDDAIDRTDPEFEPVASSVRRDRISGR